MLNRPLELVSCGNTVRPHGLLRFDTATRTPAVRAGLAKRALTLLDVSSSLPRPNVLPPNLA